MIISALLPFLITLLAVLLLSRLVSKYLLELLGDRFYAIMLWPGVVIHELSHLLGAVLTFTRVKGFSLIPKSVPGGKVLGSVTHEASGNPVTLILISLFPLLGGAFILWVLTLILVPQAPLAAPGIVVDGSFWNVIINYLGSWWSFIQGLWQAMDFGTWQTWIFLYITLAVAAHLAPSNHDFGFTAAGFTALSILAVLVVFGGNLIGQPVGDTLLGWISGAVNFFAPLLTYALSLLLLVGLMVSLAVGTKRLNERVVWW